MTTIGYGDYNAAKRPKYLYTDNMTLVMLIQFIGIFTFTLIKDRIFSLKLDIQLSAVLSELEMNTQLFLQRIDKVMRVQWEHKKGQL